ncbi:hypothetical protein N657DRAFT_635807 [Parathielavia appendiculata]|uniref:Uncharacterized protein n=1 Tax=Parathielavia appendiculata TaxID=2587402 RepID=A0AAN6Z1A4_9PEZI|nr:hypothetical protein N657DRAFT_635807 [Parathielavia appendiculata]
MTLDSNCLGVAIDHRIRRLIEPVEYFPRDKVGDHLSILMTEAGQPRDDHSFESGVKAVIEDCATLRALEAVFFTMSGRRLDLRDISVIDLLPYTMDNDWEDMANEEKARAFKAAQWAIGAKEPDVVLCAGKRFLPGKVRGLKDDMWKLESQGVGAILLERYPIRRVNGFHPSYAINYLPEHSCLRQLLFLVVAQTCAVYSKASWKEEAWMTALRNNCSTLYEDSKAVATYKLGSGTKDWAEYEWGSATRLKEKVIPAIESLLGVETALGHILDKVEAQEKLEDEARERREKEPMKPSLLY